jgi:hypothetical protein
MEQWKLLCAFTNDELRERKSVSSDKRTVLNDWLKQSNYTFHQSKGTIKKN